MKAIMAIVGPTASGKTQLAFDLAAHWPIEIISMDSAQVFQEMNIGTAKPSTLEQAQLTHHLIDIIDPTNVFSAAQFIEVATRLIPEIWAKNKIPVLVGGTFLYLSAFRYGINDLPEKLPMLRQQLMDEGLEKGWPALHEQLAQIDPQRASRIEPHDSQRIQRALEVYYATGKPMSDFLGQREKVFPDTPLWVVGLDIFDRKPLHQKINERFEQMVDNGLVEEVQSLRNKYSLEKDTPSMRCVGYRQAWKYLDGGTNHDTFVASGQAATRQLAKRQLTWLKKTDLDLRLSAYEEKNTEQLMRFMTEKFARL